VERAWGERRAGYMALLAQTPTSETDGTPTPEPALALLSVLLDALTREVESQQRREVRRYGWVMLAGLAGIAALIGFSNLASMRRLRRIDRLRQAALEQAARQSDDNRLLTQVAARTSNLALITDAQRRIVWVNASFERTTGWTLPEVRGRRPGELLLGPQTDVQTVAFMRQELQHGRGFAGVELVNYDREGRPYWVELDVQPLVGVDGRISHFIAIESVITERRRAMAELASAQDVADQANLAKTRFLAGISHELRTPLDGVLGLAQVLLADERALDATLRHYLRTISTSGKHMAELVEDMLDLSRIEAGDLAVAREEVDLEQPLESVCRILSTQAAALEVAVR